MIAEITPKGVALETADLWRRAQTPGDAGGTDARRRDHDTRGVRRDIGMRCVVIRNWSRTGCGCPASRRAGHCALAN